jgi:hypothetical protein
MWQIRTASGSVEEVLRENSNLITLNFNEGMDQEFCLQVRCLVTNAISYDVLRYSLQIFDSLNGSTMDRTENRSKLKVALKENDE